jgi:hypothetical protein
MSPPVQLRRRLQDGTPQRLFRPRGNIVDHTAHHSDDRISFDGQVRRRVGSYDDLVVSFQRTVDLAQIFRILPRVRAKKNQGIGIRRF